MGKLRFPVLLLFFASLPLSLLAQERAPGPLAGTWEGTWLSPSGFVYLAEMRLELNSSGAVEGEIKWALTKSPRAEEQPKVGMTGTEFVRGKFDSTSNVLAIDGYRKDDPNQILGLDKYRLILAENGAALGGITWNHGSWRGLIGLSRKNK